MPLTFYKGLRKPFGQDHRSPEVRRLLGEAFRACLALLLPLQRIELVSFVPNKQYLAFASEDGTKRTRAVNTALFNPDFAEWEAFAAAMEANELHGFEPARITRLIYSVAISFCCAVDLIHDRDNKTPATFFEYLIGHLFAWRLGVNPQTSIQVLNLDNEETHLTTDFIFDLGEQRPKFHLPLKTSTRERVIQVWAHQRVLDGVFGTGRFLGTPVILTETKTDAKKGEVIEICLPEQWRIYQMHIAQLKRVYYLDMPAAYIRLNEVFPPIHVKEFGEFFWEVDALVA